MLRRLALAACALALAAPVPAAASPSISNVPPSPQILSPRAVGVEPASVTLAAQICTEEPIVTHFEYGPTAAYGQRTPDELADPLGPACGEHEMLVTARVTGLTPDTELHWRLVASFPGKGTSSTADQTVRTAPAGAPAGLAAPTVTRDGGTLHCSPGAWNDPGAEISYLWSPQAFQPAGDSAEIWTEGRYGCEVHATNAAGTSFATAFIVIDEAAPRVVGTAEIWPGSVFGSPGALDCYAAGGNLVILNAREIAYSWLRDGATIPGADRDVYFPVPDDVGHVLACRMSATGAGVTAVAQSRPVRLLWLRKPPPPEPSTQAPAATPRVTLSAPRSDRVRLLAPRELVGRRALMRVGHGRLRRVTLRATQWLRLPRRRPVAVAVSVPPFTLGGRPFAPQRLRRVYR